MGMHFYGKRAVSFLLCALLACTVVFALPSASSMAQTEAAVCDDQIVVLYKEPLPQEDLARSALSDGLVERVSSAGQVEILQPEDPAQADDLLAALRENPDVLAADYNCALSMMELPNDPYVQPGGMAWQFAGVGADEVWRQADYGGAPVVIGVIDSGLDTAHPELQGRIAQGYDYVRNRTDVIDLYGHGTQVAGCAVSLVNNSLGLAGVCGLCDVRIAPFRAGGTHAGDRDLDLGMVLSAISEIVNNRPDIRIVNLSFGTTVNIETLEAAIRLLTDSGRVVVAAAGNYGDDVPVFPAYYDGVISVGATTAQDERASMSSYNDHVDLSAPGASILTTDTGGGYALTSGTSFSSPIVAGCAALLLAKRPALSALEVENALRATALDLGTPGRDDYFGAGRVQLDRAVPYDNSTGALTLRNTVTGREGERDKAFTFTLSLTAAGSYPYTGNRTGTIAHGGSITLKSGESIRIANLPTQSLYFITELEANANGYVTTATNSCGIITAGGSTANFINRRGEIVTEPTHTPDTSEPAPAPKAYALLKDGTGVVWRADDRLDFTVADAKAESLTQVSIDGYALTAGKDYTLLQQDGRLTVELLPALAAKLQKGAHALLLSFSDGSLQTTFDAGTLSLEAAAAVPATGGAGGGFAFCRLALYLAAAGRRLRRGICRTT